MKASTAYPSNTQATAWLCGPDMINRAAYHGSYLEKQNPSFGMTRVEGSNHRLRLEEASS